MRKPLHIAAIAVLVAVGPVHAGAFDEAASAYTARDYPRAAELWRDLAAGGDALAQFNIAILHDLGRGVERDHAEAARWFRRSAEQGDAIAAYNLAQLHAEGRGEVLQDYAEAAHWYNFAAERGHATAMLRLANLYANGRGVGQDLRRALQLEDLGREAECLLDDVTMNHEVRVAPDRVLMGG